jgi:hypothetical protein
MMSAGRSNCTPACGIDRTAPELYLRLCSRLVDATSMISDKTDETRFVTSQRLTLLPMRLQERVALRRQAMLNRDHFQILQSMDIVVELILLERREWHRFYRQARIEYRLRFGNGRARRHQGQRDPGQDRLHRCGRVLRCGQVSVESDSSLR